MANVINWTGIKQITSYKMKKELFENPTIEVVVLDENEVISTGDCCGDGHCGD